MKEKSENFDYPITIREHHLDTFGHVNNAFYLQIFEEARWEFISQKGYGLDTVHSAGKGPVILEVNMQFKKEIKNRQNIIIRSFCYAYNGKIGKIQQTMVNEKGEEACVAVFTFGFFDLKARKLIDPTSEWLKAVGLLD